MMHYWTNLNERERWTVGGGAVCTLLYLLYVFVVSPLTTAVRDRNNQLNEKQETLIWMKQVNLQPKKQKQPLTISNSKLLTLAATQLSNQPFQKFPHQLQQTGQGDIQITFDTVPYNESLIWLWTLTQEYAVTLKQVTAERTDTSGVVKLMISFAAK